MSTYHQILVPVDGSPTSEKALDEAISLFFGAERGAYHCLNSVKGIEVGGLGYFPCIESDV